MSRDQMTSPGAARRSPQGFRRFVYTCGRLLQGFGLILIWWVLLLFAGVADMWVLLYWTLAAALVFYLGWIGVQWGTRGARVVDVARDV